MGLMDTIKSWFSKGKGMAGDVAGKAGDMVESAADKVGDVAEAGWDKAKDVAEDIKDKFDGDDEGSGPAGDA